ncbi:MAG: hypothetical protein H6510_16015 [Acidobacteria bacterium]|nr:hypothetical protein [Acidobacteriota bacterium]
MGVAFALKSRSRSLISNRGFCGSIFKTAKNAKCAKRDRRMCTSHVEVKRLKNAHTKTRSHEENHQKEIHVRSEWCSVMEVSWSHLFENSEAGGRLTWEPTPPKEVIGHPLSNPEPARAIGDESDLYPDTVCPLIFVLRRRFSILCIWLAWNFIQTLSRPVGLLIVGGTLFPPLLLSAWTHGSFGLWPLVFIWGFLLRHSIFEGFCPPDLSPWKERPDWVAEA